jgi:hypothetical protein
MSAALRLGLRLGQRLVAASRPTVPAAQGFATSGAGRNKFYTVTYEVGESAERHTVQVRRRPRHRGRSSRPRRATTC